jgi:hypothetical protein
MLRRFALAGILALLLLLPIQTYADKQVGVLRHFADMPTGLSAEGLAIDEGHLRRTGLPSIGGGPCMSRLPSQTDSSS